MKLEQELEMVKQRQALESLTKEQLKEVYMDLLRLYFGTKNTIAQITRNEAFR